VCAGSRSSCCSRPSPPRPPRAILFKPDFLPAGTVGIRYEAVIPLSIAGHHPALGKGYLSYTVGCYGADPKGGHMDDCAAARPQPHRLRGPGCAPPLSRPDCVVLSGKPRPARRVGSPAGPGGPKNRATMASVGVSTLAATTLRLEGRLPYTGRFADVAPRFTCPHAVLLLDPASPLIT
jgi:hypothetical protein